ncbi:MAG: YbhB/YbcL family Raf kinase inhibitor-like protein [Capsulimonadaceae bacterium]
MPRLDVRTMAADSSSRIYPLYTCDGAGISPPIRWSGIPAATKSIAVVMDDTDAPAGDFVHWVLFNLPASTTHLDDAVPDVETLNNGAVQGVNDFGATGYGGPCPPAGSPHHYHIHVYALDSKLAPTPRITREQLGGEMHGHILAAGEVTVTYQRQ